MSQRLKKSFVTVTMLSAALVLVVLMGIVNLVSLLERTGSDTELLQYLADNGGRFPETVVSIEQWSFEIGAPDGRSGRSGKIVGRNITAETPYETRYFSVLLDPAGEPVSVDTSRIAAVTGQEAADAARGLFLAGRLDGRYDSYRYMAVERGDGVLYVFLDCSKTIESSRSFLIDSAVVTAIGLAVLFGLAWLLSGRAIRPMVESYEKQKSFITNAGHELKTPLAVIESSTEVIELEEGENQWTRSIHGQVRRLASLTQDLIAIARMDEQEQRLELSDQDVSQLVSDALEPYAMLAGQRGLGFTAELQPGLRLRTNPDALEKLCVILADNAVKYTADGGDIRFTLAREGGHVLLREENPADGLTAGKQEKLFDRFYRGDASRSSETPGYGLGLPLARQLAEAMGGRLHAESPDGRRLIVTARL